MNYAWFGLLKAYHLERGYIILSYLRRLLISNEDVGKAIGLKFNGDNMNMFSVLSRAGRGKRESKKLVEGVGGGMVWGGC